MVMTEQDDIARKRINTQAASIACLNGLEKKPVCRQIKYWRDGLLAEKAQSHQVKIRESMRPGNSSVDFPNDVQ
jgi:hypothetical protein